MVTLELEKNRIRKLIRSNENKLKIVEEKMRKLASDPKALKLKLSIGRSELEYIQVQIVGKPPEATTEQPMSTNTPNVCQDHIE